MNTEMTTYSGRWEAPRWMKVEAAIKGTALLLDLDCKTQVCKGLICENGVFKVGGDTNSVIRFEDWFENAISSS